MSRVHHIASLARKWAEGLSYANSLRDDPSTPEFLEAFDEVKRLGNELRIAATPVEPGMHPKHLHIIRHSLGVNADKPRSGGYRNHYGPGTADIPIIEDMVSKGLMQWCARGLRAEDFAMVTEQGARRAGCLSAWRKANADR